MVEPVRRSASWTRSGAPEDALSAVEAYARRHKGRIKKSGNQLTLNFGSKLAYRLMGISTARIPYAVRVSVAASQGTATTLSAEAFSNAGPYLWRIEPATGVFEQLLSEILNQLQEQ
jgi:hypothetical protein